MAPVFSLLCKAGHFLPLVVDPCNEADAARGREGRRKGDEKAEWWLQDHVGVHPTPRIVSHLGSLKASPGLLGKDNQNWPPRLRCHPPSRKKRRSSEANKRGEQASCCAGLFDTSVVRSGRREENLCSRDGKSEARVEKCWTQREDADRGL